MCLGLQRGVAEINRRLRPCRKSPPLVALIEGEPSIQRRPLSRLCEIPIWPFNALAFLPQASGLLWS